MGKLKALFFVHYVLLGLYLKMVQFVLVAQSALIKVSLLRKKINN